MNTTDITLDTIEEHARAYARTRETLAERHAPGLPHRLRLNADELRELSELRTRRRQLRQQLTP